MISAYLKELAEALAFDPALRARVLQEVGDHLEQSLEEERIADPHDAERRAIARFGDPHELVAQFAAVSLTRHARRISIAVVLATLATMVMMKARVAWYAVVQWTIAEDARAIAGLVLAIDRYAFWLAVAIGIGALVYIGRLATPMRVHAEYRGRLRRAALLFASATAALTVSVLGDLVLTALQVRSKFGPSSVIPIASIAIEIACIGVIVVLIVTSARRTARTSASLGI
jgi:hypothetical protein